MPEGQAGELIVRNRVPWTMAPAYYGMPERTVEAWRNGWFHTGDVMRRDAEGWYYLVDRLSDAIRRRGENISSAEVESVVRAFPGVIDCAAVAAPAIITSAGLLSQTSAAAAAVSSAGGGRHA